MKPVHYLPAVLCGLLLGLTPACRADEIQNLLKQADMYRIGDQNMQVETRVTSYQKDGSQDKQRDYLVFAQANRQSLVLMQSPAEKGQKVLMLADDFWLLMPGSQRAMRITPMQKLLGDASIGDIATMNWAGDYDGELKPEQVCDNRPCLHLTLQARRPAVAYQRIELWLGKKHHEPIRAELYVQSEKLAKQASFIMNAAGAPHEVTEMVLLDQLSNNKETRVRYLSRKPRSVPVQWLNPMFLAKNPDLN